MEAEKNITKQRLVISMQLSDLNPHIRYARIHKGIFTLRKDRSVCYDCRVFYFDNTCGTITIGNEKYDISNKTLIYLPPETHYWFHIQFQSSTTCTVLNFDLTNEHCALQESLGTVSERAFDPALVPSYTLPDELRQPIVQTLPSMEHTLTQCADHFLLQNPLYRERASALLKLVLLELIHQNRQDSSSAICNSILQYIQGHYARHTLTNKEIAKSFHYHPDYISALLRKETGKTLHQHIILYRLRMAKNLLITTQYDISEIAWRCGFCSCAYFIKQFREITGITPKQYRKQKIHTEF